MPFSPRAFLFKKFIISLLIFSVKIIGLILSTLYSIIISILILLRSTVLALGKNLTIKISAFTVLLSVKGSLINLLKFSRWGSAFTILAFLLHFNKSKVLYYRVLIGL
jgi:hypothetical protein